MNAETDHLRFLARRVVQAAVRPIPVRAALLAGSAGRGNADRFSDIDLLFYVEAVPTNEAIAQVRNEVGGVDPCSVTSRPTTRTARRSSSTVCEPR